MAIIIFPPNPNQGDTFTADNGVVYTYDGVKWEGATGNLLNVTTDVIPSANVSYSLGNSTNQWQDLWVSGNTIYINSVPVTVDGATLQVDGANVITATGASDISVTGNIEASYFLGNGAFLTGISGGNGNANTGNITFDASTISTNTANADITIQGNGTGTINLVTNAGGYTQLQNDSANNGSSYVYLENGGVYIESSAGTWSFGTNGQVTLPDNTQMGAVEGANTFGFYNSNANTEFLLEAAGNAWSFNGATGNITLPSNTSSINYANGAPYGGSGTGYSNAEVATFLADYGSNSISTTGSITAGSITQNGIGNINGYNGYFANNLTTQGTLQATALIIPTGSGTFYGNVDTGVNALFAGLPGYTELGSNVIAQFAGNVDSYAQINLQNLNTGNLASADYIITSDIGNNSAYYLDLGLASSNHDDPYFFGDVGFAHDGYLTVVGPDYAGPSTSAGPGNLVLGSSNGLIKMFVGNAAQANVIATVSSSGLNVLGNITTAGDSGNITGANVISANTLTALNITQTGTGNINGYNGYYANNVTVQGTLQATGLIVPQGNGTFFGNSVSGNDALFAGVPGYTLLGSNVVVQFAGNSNSYSQVNFQNIDSGSAATTDYIATADTGTDSTYYLDMGIAGSTYDNTNPNVSLGTSLFPLDSYVFSAGSTNITPGGNLVVGTITPERVISFIAGGVNDTEIVQVIANTGISVYRSISSTGNIIAGNISTLETGGNITGNTVTAATAVVTTPTTVDNLPSAVAAGPGARSFVIDSNTIAFYSNVGNAGSNSVPVFSDGTSWRVG